MIINQQSRALGLVNTLETVAKANAERDTVALICKYPERVARGCRYNRDRSRFPTGINPILLHSPPFSGVRLIGEGQQGQQ